MRFFMSDIRAALAALVLYALAGSAVAASGPAPGAGLEVLLVSQRGGPNRAQDDAVATRLRQRGYRVRLEDQTLAPDRAAGAGLVIISSSVSSKDVAPGWRQLPVPLLTWENDLLDDLAMAGKRHDVDFGSVAKERYLWLVNAPHAMSAGLPAGVANVHLKQAGMSWGKPGLGATLIATLYGQPEKAAIFGYETGATMDYETLAPARRVMFFLDNDTFGNLSPTGLRLFDAAVDWAAGR
ncbi:MAG TPA: hypothetical protein DDZ67_09240 [Xanthomonadaceae bacterium]|nr:hypothetical protein [Xanthomonadaceae bacterium]